ncbi:single-stranded DNA-binding protein [Streptomyces zaomyceticus]|uniref:single-stranded DNA-binding protein n=1 Tax=Streptomyces zaomyceticus TaxID=68286 RepID=UPI001675048D|nr:single-stranded DNA-binding protein [Streptomyces zaomyceticus]
MNDTTVTLVGNVATAVEYRDTATGGVARFRFAVSARRWDREKSLWSDGPTSFYTVSAWRSLGANLAASVSVGEPLVVHGRLRVREDERDGQRKTFVDVAALAVGHDLSRGTAAFRRAAKMESRSDFRSDPRSEPWSEPRKDPGSEPASDAGGGRGTLWDEGRDAGPELGPAPGRDPWTVAAADAATEGTTRLVTVP